MLDDFWTLEWVDTKDKQSWYLFVVTWVNEKCPKNNILHNSPPNGIFGVEGLVLEEGNIPDV